MLDQSSQPKRPEANRRVLFAFAVVTMASSQPKRPEANRLCSLIHPEKEHSHHSLNGQKLIDL